LSDIIKTLNIENGSLKLAVQRNFYQRAV